MKSIKQYHEDLVGFNKEIEKFTNENDIESAVAKCAEFLFYLEKLEKKSSKNEDHYKILGMGFFDLGYSYRILKIKEGAEQGYLKAMQYLGKISNSTAHAEFSATQLAACKNHLGLVYMDHGPIEKAIKYLDSAVADRKELKAIYPENNENRVFLGGALCNRAHIERNAGRIEASIPLYEKSISILNNAIPPCQCGCRDARASAISNVMGHPHWIIIAHSFLHNATGGLNLANKALSDWQ